jgi:hypothetical protein
LPRRLPRGGSAFPLRGYPPFGIERRLRMYIGGGVIALIIIILLLVWLL